jgi:hypothetical protein
VVRIPKLNPIEYLIETKFPNYKKLQLTPSLSLPGNSSISREHRTKRLQEIDAYEAELKAKPRDELLALFEKAQEAHKQELTAKAKLEEEQRYFNLPSADANFEHWSKATYWTLEEAIALSFGKEPRLVNWDRLKGYQSSYPPSPLAESYRLKRDLVLRAKNFNQLFDPSLPSLFLAWGRRNDIEIPTQLIEQVEARGIVIADWKDMYDKLKEQYDAVYEINQKLAVNINQATEIAERCAKVENERDSLQQKLDKIKEPGYKAETTYQNIIAVLLDYIEGDFSGVEKHPSFNTQTRLINAIDEKYQGYSGLSASNLSRKFPEAKRSLKSQ